MTSVSTLLLSLPCSAHRHVADGSSSRGSSGDGGVGSVGAHGSLHLHQRRVCYCCRHSLMMPRWCCQSLVLSHDIFWLTLALVATHQLAAAILLLPSHYCCCHTLLPFIADVAHCCCHTSFTLPLPLTLTERVLCCQTSHPYFTHLIWRTLTVHSHSISTGGCTNATSMLSKFPELTPLSAQFAIVSSFATLVTGFGSSSTGMDLCSLCEN